VQQQSTHTIRVRAVNALGESQSWSPSFQITTELQMLHVLPLPLRLMYQNHQIFKLLQLVLMFSYHGHLLRHTKVRHQSFLVSHHLFVRVVMILIMRL
jgi:hypothetical protein